MAKNGNSFIDISIWAAIISVIVSLLVNIFYNRWTQFWMHKKLKLEPEPVFGTNIRARVFNGYRYPLTDMYVYITIIDMNENDVVSEKDSNHFITKYNYKKLEEDRLCWAIAGNPANINIYPGERQVLDIASKGTSEFVEYIEIPSEKGWSGEDGKARIALIRKKYKAEIKLVCREMKAKSFQIEIDPLSENPITLI